MTKVIKRHPLAAEMAVMLFTWRTNIKAAMALRTAFLLQILGMMINDCAFVFVWFVFFQTIGNINGWTSVDVLALQGCGMMGLGLTLSTAAGTIWLPSYIESGSFDSLLLSPRNLLLRTITSRIDIAAIGDAVLGFLLIIVYAILQHSVMAFLVPIALTPAIASIFIAVGMLCASTAFYTMDAQNISQSLYKAFLGPTLYPSVLFPKAMKFIFTFIIPSLVVGGLPVEVAKTHSIGLFITIYLVAAFWLSLSIFVFYRSVRRYESGNFMGMRG